MKLFFPLLLSPAFLLSVVAIAEEKKEAVEKAPIVQYWDANSWEEGSSTSFWRAGSKAKAETPQERVRKTKTKQSTSESGFFDRHTEK
ncbi:MAG: hypothetical protein P1U87_07395 [Verrucomicrobiales bacterium]|nr:hypothetical protein [Verrucomicrobiales bacterium]